MVRKTLGRLTSQTPSDPLNSICRRRYGRFLPPLLTDSASDVMLPEVHGRGYH
jgi:hypothetical protein